MMIYEPFEWIIAMLEKVSAASNAVARCPVPVVLGPLPSVEPRPLKVRIPNRVAYCGPAGLPGESYF